jgi:hypothetical protein
MYTQGLKFESLGRPTPPGPRKTFEKPTFGE